MVSAQTRTPRHVGLIPDGNRRWARARGLAPEHGYAAGIEPGLQLLAACRSAGIEEVSIYGFTKENVHRPSRQVAAFHSACVEVAETISDLGAALLVVGDSRSVAFPAELRRFTTRCRGALRVNLLINYSWGWDLGVALRTPDSPRQSRELFHKLGSADVSPIQLVIRWGGRRRLSGFLPMQSAYADIHVVDTLWPDMQVDEFHDALHWYQQQDVTMGG